VFATNPRNSTEKINASSSRASAKNIIYIFSFYTMKNRFLKLRSLSMLPNGWIFGQITQTGPKQNFFGQKKLEAVKGQNFAQSCRKKGRKTFLQLFRNKTIELFSVSWQKIKRFSWLS
jgi:hypothetical protein